MRRIKIFDSIDNNVMSLVNGVNYFWNYTTGGTKKELSDICFVTYGLLATTVIFSDPEIMQSKKLVNDALLLGIAPLATFYTLKENKKLRDYESVEKNNSLSFEAESIRNEGRGIGYLSLLCTTASLLSTSKHQQIHNYSIMAQASLSLGSFLFAADNLPPRKNCVLRGIDHLVQKYELSRALA